MNDRDETELKSSAQKDVHSKWLAEYSILRYAVYLRYTASI